MSPTKIGSTRTFAALVAAGAMLAIPATSQAKPDNPGNGKPKSAKNCSKAHSVGFTVKGTLVSVTPDDAATPGNEATVTIKLTSANSHARKSGDIADQDTVKAGVQVDGATYTIAATDAFDLKLSGYEGTETPAVGDRVSVHGKIALTKKRCAAPNTSTADRYGATDVRRVKISDGPDA